MKFTFSLFIFDIIYCSLMRLLRITLERRKKVGTRISDAYKIGTRMIIVHCGGRGILNSDNYLTWDTWLNPLFAMIEVMVYWSWKHGLRSKIIIIIFLLTYMLACNVVILWENEDELNLFLQNGMVSVNQSELCISMYFYFYFILRID